MSFEPNQVGQAQENRYRMNADAATMKPSCRQRLSSRLNLESFSSVDSRVSGICFCI